MVILGTIFAGLGLFFIGIKLISANLKEMSGATFRRLIARVTEHPLLGGLIGVIGGALTQSTNAITFIVISMVTAGMIELRRSLPILIWANLGTSALVLLATLDIHLAILFLLGVTGLGFYFDLDKSSRYRYPLGVLLGIATLFYGLDLIKSGASPLQTLPFVQDLLQSASQSMLLAFVIGVLVTLIVQSSATVSVISVALISVGLLSFDQGVMIVFGASLGSGLSVLLLSANLTGTGRQVALFQVTLKVIGLIVLMPVFLTETLTQTPLLIERLRIAVPSLDLQLAMVYLILQFVSCAAMTVISAPAARLIARISPPSHEEALSSPQFLYPQAVDDAQSALDLVACEQTRLLKRLPLFLNSVRDEPEHGDEPEAAGADADTLYRASTSVAAACDEFLTDLTMRTRSPLALERIVNLQSRGSLIAQLQDSAIELAQTLEPPAQDSGAERMRNNVAEGMHALLDRLADAADGQDADDLDLLLQVSQDRSGAMQRLRANLLGRSKEMSPADKQQVLDATTLVERVTWLIRRYVRLLKQQH